LKSLDSETNEPLKFNPFGNPVKSFMKSIIMLTGEFDYVSTFENKLPYEGTTHLIFMLFVMLVTLILGNLLVALAVNELQEIQGRSDVQRVANMLKLISDLECVIPKKIVYSLADNDPPFLRPYDRETRDELQVPTRHKYPLVSFLLPWADSTVFMVRFESMIE
jgi:hypothetical protein